MNEEYGNHSQRIRRTPTPMPRNVEECNEMIRDLKVRLKHSLFPENEIIEQKIRDIAHIKAAYRTTQILDSRTRDFVSEGSEPVQIQNLQYDDSHEEVGNEQKTVSFSNVHTHLALSDYFKRPVQIANFAVVPGVERGFLTTIKIWEKWSSNSSVRGKLLNYAFFKGNLKIKIFMNPTKFQFGSIMFSYQPLIDQNPNYLTYKHLQANVTDKTKINSSTINYLSQSPEMLHMYFSENFVGEMTLPFICPRNSCRLFNQSVDEIITKDTPYDDLLELGELNVSIVNTLKSFNGSTQPINFQIFAYVEDIELGPPTATDLDVEAEGESEKDLISALRKLLAPAANSIANSEAGKSISKIAGKESSDEYADSGPVTKVASAVSNVSNKMKDVPFIGDFAKATSMVTSKVAKVANMFGFSKPLNIDIVQSFRPLVSDNFATLSGMDSSVKLACDPKQELSITPLGGEIDKDPMSISFLTSRRSLFHTFDWKSDDTPLTSTLAYYFLDPAYVCNDEVGQKTALAFATLPFAFWRGTISYHFKVASSGFHRGKLIIIYEPNVPDCTLIASAPNTLNQQYFTILDLEYDREIIVDVGYVFNKNFSRLDTGTLGSPDSFGVGIPTLGSTPRQRINAGLIYVKPFTTLKGGDSTESNSVSINVSVFSDDIELGAPRDIGFNKILGTAPVADGLTLPTIVSEGEVMHGTEFQSKTTTASGTQTDAKRVLINQHQHSTTDNAFLYNIGERVTSFRSLLKRYFRSGEFEVTVGDGGQIIAMDLPLYPPQTNRLIPQSTNFVPQGADSFVGDTNARCVDNLFNYLRHGYLLLKGGMRFKVRVPGVVGLSDMESSNILYNLFNENNDFRITRADRDAFQVVNVSAPGCLGSGTHFFSEKLNPVMEFEVPFYSTDLFYPTCGYIPVGTTHDLGLFDMDGNAAHINLYPNEGAAIYIQVQQAVAEDFTFFRFQGAPLNKYSNVVEPPNKPLRTIT